MKSHEVIKAAAGRIGVKALAAGLRLSQAMVYKWCEPPGDEWPEASGALNPLDRVSAMYRLTGHRPMIDWLCEQAGGYFVPNPSPADAHAGDDLLQSTQHVIRGFSRLLDEVSAAAADDGAITGHEAERIRAEWQRLKTVAESFVVACEQGVYRRAPAGARR